MYKKYLIRKSFVLPARHAVYLNGRTEKPHQHDFSVTITYTGPITPDGIIVDFKELEHFVDIHILKKLHNKNLNNILKNPTTESIAEFIWDKAIKFKDTLFLYEVEVCENSDSCIIIRGQDS